MRNAVVMPAWNAVQPALTVTAAGGAVTAVTVGTEHGLGWDPYGTSVPVAFSGSCTAQATASGEQQWVDWSGERDAGRSGLLGDDDGERERGGDMGYGGAGEFDRRAGHDVLRRKSAEGQRRIHGVERERISRATGRSWMAAAGTLPGGGTYAALVGSSRAGSDIAGGSVSGRGYWGARSRRA